jgi:RNA polymerase sigma factor (sigma-70 family)
MARRHSLCLDDAHDAYQRGVEIFIRRAASLEPDGVVGWLHTVVKHEAMAVRRARQQLVAGEECDLDAHPSTSVPDVDDQVDRFERLARSAEALSHLKPQELRALWLKAQGHSYKEIAQITGWTYTKVNRCLTEGRRSFLTRYAQIEAGVECRNWAPALSAMADGEATAQEILQLRPHLRRCAGCRATLRELHESGLRVAAVVPAVGLAIPLGGEPESNLLARLIEAIAGGVHERAMGSAVKAQAALEAATTGKVAAVAASAAAFAGSGLAVVDSAIDRPSETRRARITSVAADANRGKAAAKRATAAPVRVAEAPVVAPAPAPAAAPRAASARKRRNAPRREFDFEVAAATASATAPQASTKATAATAPAGGGEFGP